MREFNDQAETRAVLGSGFNFRPYHAYSYSYPHKSAYGPLEPVVDLRELWQTEERGSLFLYVHIPFCEMRCGFCNLFTRVGGEHLHERYLDTLERQLDVMADSTEGERSFSRLAIGGGTPTVLDVGQLDRLFTMLRDRLGVDVYSARAAVETSPKTSTRDRLALLRDWGVHRVSIGVQSFVDAEVQSIGRPQQAIEAHSAIRRIRDVGIPCLNVDLIYGQPGQTLASWMYSLETALEYEPEELFLYPLYVRPNTGIAGKTSRGGDDHLRQCYESAREHLLKCGYEQFSMRCFTKAAPQTSMPNDSEATSGFSCQEDGMLGLGCGARSYTSNVHYSSPFAVQKTVLAGILDSWINQRESDFKIATWGIRLNEDERRRRFAIQSLLNRTGLDRHAFSTRFGVEPHLAIPELDALASWSYLEEDGDVLRLNPEGMGLSDAIGPFLYSAKSRVRLEEFTRV